MAAIIFGLVLLALGGWLLYNRKQNLQKTANIAALNAANIGELLEIAQTIRADLGGQGAFHEMVGIRGNITSNNPLSAPLSQKPCVFYRHKVSERYQVTERVNDAEGNERQETKTGNDIVQQGQQRVRFYLEDNDGQRLLVDPESANIEARNSVDDFQAAAGMASTLRFGSFQFNFDKSHFRQPNRKVLGYHYEESVLELGQEVYAVGELSDQGGELLLSKPRDNSVPFIITPKSKDELLSARQRNAKNTLIAAIVILIIGAALLLFGLF